MTLKSAKYRQSNGEQQATSNHGSLTTIMAGDNNDIVVSAKVDGIAGNSNSIQAASMGGRLMPAAVYEGGIPASVIIHENENPILIVAKEPGEAGNSITVKFSATLVPNQPLTVNVDGTAIDIIGATDSEGAAEFLGVVDAVAAINESEEASALVLAISYGDKFGDNFIPTSAEALTGGEDIEGLTFVRLGTDDTPNFSNVTTTGEELAALLTTDNLTASNADGNDGSGIVTAISRTSLSGGVDVEVEVTTSTSKFVGRISGIVTYNDDTYDQFAVHRDERGDISLNDAVSGNQAIVEIQDDNNWLEDMLDLVSSTLVLAPIGTALKTVNGASFVIGSAASYDDFLSSDLTAWWGSIIGNAQVTV